jgi:hypothetical protein
MLGAPFGAATGFGNCAGFGIEIGAAYLAGEMEIGPGQHFWRASLVGLLIFDR